MIKQTIIGSVAVLTLLSVGIAAHAADAIVETTPVYDWSGAYIGGQIGYAGGHENDDLSDNFTAAGGNIPVGALSADDFSMNGFVGGVYGGVNYQMPNNFVLGIEGDFNGSSFKGDHDFNGLVPEPEDPDFFLNYNGSLEMKSDWQASVRGRIGYAMDRTLFYGTGGVAFARAQLRAKGSYFEFVDGSEDESGPDAPFDESDTKTLVGYTVGLGIEHAFTDNWIGKLEGRYTDFGSKTFESDLADVKADFNQGQVLVGIAYKF